MNMNRKVHFAEYLKKTYGVRCSNVDFSRHVKPLYAKMAHRPLKRQILIQGLIGMALGAYSLYDQRMIELANEIIEKFSPLI